MCFSPFVFGKQSYPNPNKNGELPLHLAVQLAKLEVVQYLGDTCPKALEVTEKDGWLPLHVAVQQAKLEVIQNLGDKCPKALEVMEKYGWLPLHLAAAHDKLEVIYYLCKKCPTALRATANDGTRPAVAARDHVQLDPAKTVEPALVAPDPPGSIVRHQSSAVAVSNAGPYAALTQDPHAQHRAAVRTVAERQYLVPQLESNLPYIKAEDRWTRIKPLGQKTYD